MKRVINVNRLLLLGILTTVTISNISAKDSYIGIKFAKLNSDKTVLANTSGYENMGYYKRYDDFSLLGIEIQKFYLKHNSPLLWGGSGSLMLNKSKLLDGGILDFNFKLGGHFDKLKVYGILGVGIQSLSEYTASSGFGFGIGTIYDVSDSFGITANYMKYNMNTFTNQGEGDLSDDQDYKLSGFLLGAMYKY